MLGINHFIIYNSNYSLLIKSVISSSTITITNYLPTDQSIWRAKHAKLFYPTVYKTVSDFNFLISLHMVLFSHPSGINLWLRYQIYLFTIIQSVFRLICLSICRVLLELWGMHVLPRRLLLSKRRQWLCKNHFSGVFVF